MTSGTAFEAESVIASERQFPQNSSTSPSLAFRIPVIKARTPVYLYIHKKNQVID